MLIEASLVSLRGGRGRKHSGLLVTVNGQPGGMKFGDDVQAKTRVIFEPPIDLGPAELRFDGFNYIDTSCVNETTVYQIR